MPAGAQRLRGTVDVRVDLVRLRPREGRDEANPEAHRSQVTASNSARQLATSPQDESLAGMQIHGDTVLRMRGDELDAVQLGYDTLASRR